MNRGRLAAIVALVIVAVGVAVLVVRGRDRQAAPPESSSASTSSVLVLTWAPSLCSVETSASGCRSGKVSRLGKSFVLHGLWPQPRSQQYCDVPKKAAARERKPLALPPDLDARLKTMMSDSNVMAPHEWYAHGTCSGVNPVEYFTIATRLADQAIAILDPLFDRWVGRQLTSRSVRDAVEAQAGSGAGARVSLVCRGAQGAGPVAYEVRLSLPPVVQLRAPAPSLPRALSAGPAVPPGCGQARVP
jgi:ribonuclease T2